MTNNLNACQGCAAFDHEYGCMNLIRWIDGTPEDPPCFEHPEQSAVIVPFPAKAKTSPTEAAP